MTTTPPDQSLEQADREAAEAYAQVWLVNAIERVKASLHNPDDIPTVLEVAFTDGYLTGQLHERARLQAEIEKLRGDHFVKDYQAACVRADVAEREIERLHKVIAKELSENDELGAEYTYVRALKEEIGRLNKHGYEVCLDYEKQLEAEKARRAECAAEIKRLETQARELVKALEIIASHDYAGIAMADAHITLAREAIAKFKGDRRN